VTSEEEEQAAPAGTPILLIAFQSLGQVENAQTRPNGSKTAKIAFDVRPYVKNCWAI
jgi:hypothetical protein